MSDQLYFKIQYPLKKAISSLKEFEAEEIDIDEFSAAEKREIDEFIKLWENNGGHGLHKLITSLRKTL